MSEPVTAREAVAPVRRALDPEALQLFNDVLRWGSIMATELTVRATLELARECSWPEAAYGNGQRLVGETGWRDRLGVLSPFDFQAVAQQLEAAYREQQRRAAQDRAEPDAGSPDPSAERLGQELIEIEAERQERESPAGVARRTLAVLERLEAHLGGSK